MYLGMYGLMPYLRDLQSMGVLGDVLYILVSSVRSHWFFSYSVCVSGEREGERERQREIKEGVDHKIYEDVCVCFRSSVVWLFVMVAAQQ